MNPFEELGLSQPLVEAVADLGFTVPTPIQSQAIPKLLEADTDLVGLAQTGTGKTAAFGLPLIDLVEPAESFTQGLIIAPTRELCMQITNELGQFAKYIPKLRIVAVYGGADISRQIREVKKGAHIIVATPGRLRDLMRRNVVKLEPVNYVILDEADEMLNMGFKEEIDEILQATTGDKSTWLFSATMPPDVRRIAEEYMTDPLELHAGTPFEAHADIDHQYLITRPKERPTVLKQFLEADPDIFALVFTRTRQDAQDLADDLMRDDFRAESLHGGLSQSQRDRVMDKFRNKRVRILVATDVAARGIDVQDITHVFHFNIPNDFAFYTHRSGRTGRAGSKGISIVLTHPKDVGILRQIERKQKVRFEKIEVPSGMELYRKQMLNHVRQLREISVNGELEPFMPELMAELENLTREELIKKVAANALGGRLEQLRFEHEHPGKTKNEKRDSNIKWIKLFINVGSMDLADKGAFLSMVCEQADIPGSAVGRIDLQHKHSYFEIDETYRRKLSERFSDFNLDGREIRVNHADSGGDPSRKKFKKKHKKSNSKFKKKARKY